MSAGNAETIDAITVNKTTGTVELHVIDAEEFPDIQSRFNWFADKINLCINYVLGGQINTNPKYAGKPVKVILHFRQFPPPELAPQLQAIKNHLAPLNIACVATIGADATWGEIDLDKLTASYD